MSSVAYGTVPAGSQAGSPRGWQSVLCAIEDSLLVWPLLALMVLPLVEIVLRKFHTGVSGATAFVQHFTLIVGMFGGAIAARATQICKSNYSNRRSDLRDDRAARCQAAQCFEVAVSDPAGMGAGSTKAGDSR